MVTTGCVAEIVRIEPAAPGIAAMALPSGQDYNGVRMMKLFTMVPPVLTAKSGAIRAAANRP